MISTITEVIISAVESNSYDALSATLAAIVIALLIVLLIQKELMRAVGGPRARLWAQTFNIAIVPLLLVFGAIVIRRFLELVNR